MRLINAEDVKKEIDEWLDVVGAVVIGKHLSYYGELLGCIDDAPTVEAVPVVRGEWNETKYYTWECSVCGFHPFKGYIPKEPNFNFCPNCGADMRKKVE